MSRKTRKPTSGGSRRPSQSTRRPTRARVSVAKPAHRRKPEAEGASLGMNAKKTTQRQGFKTGEFIVYPAHGVGQIVAIEEQEVAGARLELFVINFVKDKMTLRVPTSKVASVGMRKLAETPMVKRALETLKGRARIKRTMWSRRAQEYEAKINSGDIVAIAEVVRDLFGPSRSRSSRTPSGSSMKRPSTGCRVKSPPCSGSPRPRRSRRSRRHSPRARIAVPSPKWRRRRKTMPSSRKRLLRARSGKVDAGFPKRSCSTKDFRAELFRRRKVIEGPAAMPASCFCAATGQGARSADKSPRVSHKLSLI